MADPAADELGALRVAEPPLDLLSALPDDLLVRLLATAPPESIAALAPVAKRYANVCERAGWACAARRFVTTSSRRSGQAGSWLECAPLRSSSGDASTTSNASSYVSAPSVYRSELRPSTR